MPTVEDLKMQTKTGVMILRAFKNEEIRNNNV